MDGDDVLERDMALAQDPAPPGREPVIGGSSGPAVVPQVASPAGGIARLDPARGPDVPVGRDGSAGPAAPSGPDREDRAAMADARAGNEDPTGVVEAADSVEDDEIDIGVVDARLGEVEQALRRIDAGTYGHCDGCGGDIDDARLTELPTARRCVTCAS